MMDEADFFFLELKAKGLILLADFRKLTPSEQKTVEDYKEEKEKRNEQARKKTE